MLILGAPLLLLATLPFCNPRVNSRASNSSSKCEASIIGCGEFRPPDSFGAKRYICRFNKRFCGFSCSVRCNKGPDGKKMVISNRRHAREYYKCINNVWTRRDTPTSYCQANVPVKIVHQNFHHTAELNDLSNRLMNSSFIYLGMASFFERADVALPGFSKLMTDLWQANMKHARDVMTYVNARGGYINLSPIPRPSSYEDLLMTLGDRPGLAGVRAALGETRNVNAEVLQLHTMATKEKDSTDPHMKHVLEDGLVSYKVETIKKLADLESQLQFFKTDEDYIIGEYSIDLTLRE